MRLRGQRPQTHLVQCEHVEVTDIVLLSVFDASSTFLFIDHLSHIFTHEGSLRGERGGSTGEVLGLIDTHPLARSAPLLLSYLLDVRHGTQTPAAGQRSVDLHRTVLPLGEGLVLAPLPCSAHLRVALVHQHAVDALRVGAARVLVRGLAVATRDLREVGCDDLHLPNWPVYLVKMQWLDFDKKKKANKMAKKQA